MPESDNVDASNVAITADHGNTFGENNIFDHHVGLNHPTVREVPWVKTSARDKKQYILKIMKY